MFYSHDILTSRKYGMATVWLMATIGSKSLLKRVSRKDILGVDVKMACRTIETPEAPMSLRLQSNLLYGIARVHSQQCGYLVTDAETVKNHLRAVAKTMRNTQLNAGGHKARADQLLLPDEQDFLPDIDLASMDFDQLNLGFPEAAESSQRFTLSPYESQNTDHILREMPELEIHGRSNSIIGGSIGGSFGWGGSVSRRTSVANNLLLGDDLFVIEPDGTIRFTDMVAQQSAASQDYPQSQHSSAEQLERDGDVLMHDEGYNQELIAGALQPSRDRADQEKQQTTSETAVAPARRHNKPAPKVIPIDLVTELSNADLTRWNRDYVANMRKAAQRKDAQHALALAKENAKLCVLGTTVSQAAPGLPMVYIDGPLGMFSGAKLLETFTGIDWLSGGKKRDRKAADDAEDRARKRSRGSGESSNDQASSLEYESGYQNANDEEYTGVEAGREQPTPLDDRHLSSLMPWNQSTGSRRPTGIFGSAPGVPHAALSGRGSRLPSASPLVGRGHFSAGALGCDNSPQGLYSEQAGFGDFDMTGADDSELYGPAAQVHTQTAAQSQWQRTALDTETNNFLKFVKAAIGERDQSREGAGQPEEDGESAPGSISFETLLPAKSNSRAVAAQGLLHVLTLGTRNLLKVEQQEDYGPIVMHCF